VQPTDCSNRPPLLFAETRRLLGKRAERITDDAPAGPREYSGKGC